MERPTLPERMGRDHFDPIRDSILVLTVNWFSVFGCYEGYLPFDLFKIVSSERRSKYSIKLTYSKVPIGLYKAETMI